VMAPVLIFTGFLVKQKYIQHQMHEQLERTSLSTITVNTTDITWLNEGKEAEIKGRLFDVKSVKASGGVITLTGLYDEKENELKEEFDGLIKEKKGDTSPLNEMVLKILFSPAINKSNSFTATPANTTAVTITYAAYSETEQAQYIAITTPPPNI